MGQLIFGSTDSDTPHTRLGARTGRRGFFRLVAGLSAGASAMWSGRAGTQGGNAQHCQVNFTTLDAEFTVKKGGANLRHCPRLNAIRYDVVGGNIRVKSNGYTTNGEPVWDPVLNRMNPVWYRASGSWISATRLEVLHEHIERGVRHAVNALD